MISYRELLSGHTVLDIPTNVEQNLQELAKRINVVRSLWGKPMVVTSGYRTRHDQIRIYTAIARKRGIDNPRIPMGSAHLTGCAVDIADPDGSLGRWLKADPSILEGAQLWCEEIDSTPRIHFQSYPPGSGKRWFLP
jgi:hypothetical protein